MSRCISSFASRFALFWGYSAEIHLWGHDREKIKVPAAWCDEVTLSGACHLGRVTNLKNYVSIPRVRWHLCSGLEKLEKNPHFATARQVYSNLMPSKAKHNALQPARTTLPRQDRGTPDLFLHMALITAVLRIRVTRLFVGSSETFQRHGQYK